MREMDAHLSAMESIMWRAASDPMLRMTVGALVVVDQAPSASALRAHLVAAAERAPRLRQRPGELSPTRPLPAWIADDIDVDHHLRFAAVPAPGSLLRECSQ